MYLTHTRFTRSRWLILLLIFVISAMQLYGQVPFRKLPVVGSKAQDNFRDTLIKKKFGRAAGELMLAEVIPWTFDRYVANKDYARIAWKTVGHNLNPGSW